MRQLSNCQKIIDKKLKLQLKSIITYINNYQHTMY